MTCGVFVGVDVSKDRLDVAFRPSGEKLIVPNDRRGDTRLVRTITRLKPECVVLEASGGFERKLLERLSEAGAPIARVNARNVREFARAWGRLAKTDAIDAAVLPHFAEAMKPELRRFPRSGNSQAEGVDHATQPARTDDDGRAETATPVSREAIPEWLIERWMTEQSMDAPR